MHNNHWSSFHAQADLPRDPILRLVVVHVRVCGHFEDSHEVFLALWACWPSLKWLFKYILFVQKSQSI